MITLLTGLPGTGKTAYAVKMLAEDANIQGRPFFTNIVGLTIPHIVIDAAWIRDWHQSAPADAFILFDECQDVFPPRHVSKEVPEHVSELSTHRHRGVDFFLITQQPSLIDHAVRSLVGRHLHIRETGLTRMIHEAPEIVDFREKSIREVYAGQPYVLPKHVFDLYKSSQLHTKKPRRRLPTAFYVFAFAALLAVGLGAYVYKNRIAPALSHVDPVSDGIGAGLPAPAVASGIVVSAVPTHIVEALTPTDDHNPLSAPLYASVTPPVVAPEIQGCIASRKRCTCYSQQQTPVWLPDEQCRQRAAGAYFDPYRQPPPPQIQQAQAHTLPASAEQPKEKGVQSSAAAEIL